MLNNLCVKHNEIKEIRGRGLMMAVEFTNEEQASHVHQYLFDQKIICGQKNATIRFMPPLVIDHGLILKVTDTIEQALSQNTQG